MAHTMNIPVSDIVPDIRACLTDEQLMQKYGLSARALQGLYRQLIAKGLLHPLEIYGRGGPPDQSIRLVDYRECARRNVPFLMKIVDRRDSDRAGIIVDISKSGVKITGMDVTMGETESFVVIPDGTICHDPIEFDTECKWVSNKEDSEEVTAGFQIVDIDQSNLERLLDLIESLPRPLDRILISDEPHEDEDNTESLDLANFFSGDVTVSGSFRLTGIHQTWFGRLLKALPINCVVLDEALRITFANQARHANGITVEDLVGRRFQRLFPDELLSREAEAAARRVFSTRKVERLQGAIELDDMKVWGRLHFRPLRIGHDRALLVIIEDLSAERELVRKKEQHNRELYAEVQERRKAEEELRRGEAKYRFLTESMQDILWTADLNLNTTYVSPSVQRVLGFTPEERISQNPRVQLTPSSLKKAEKMLADILELDRQRKIEIGGSITRVFEYYRKDGTIVPLESTLSLIRDEQGNPIGLHGLSRDISERLKAEEEIARSREHARAVLESVTDGFISLDYDLIIQYFNRAAEKLLGLQREQVIGRSVFDALPPEIKDQLEGRLTQIVGQKEPVTSEIHTSRSLQERWYEVRIYPYQDGLSIYLQEVTERKRREKLTIQTERFRAVAELASGIAHNFNNLLQVVIGAANVAMVHVEKENFIELRNHLQQIIDISFLGAETVNRLNTFAGAGNAPSDESPTVFDLSKLVEEAVEVTKPLWQSILEKRGVTAPVSCELNSGLLVRAKKNEIFELVVNLLKNAAEAHEESGAIQVSTSNDDGEALLIVEDCGKGISQEDLPRIFTPFFSSKLEAGSGLGLATAHSIIRDHGGAISVESEEGKGAKFKVRLPRVLGPAHSEAPTREAATRTPLSVVVVDDNQAILDTIRTGLELFGHTVLTFLSGREALASLEKDLPDVVICDLGMPDMSGRQVGESIKKRCHDKGIPKPAFLLFTGWEDQTPAAQRMSESGVDGVVTKPLNLDQLILAMERVLRSK